MLSRAGYSVRAMVIDDPVETAGVNDRAQLAAAEAELRDRINERWMRRGVTMWDPERTYVDTRCRARRRTSRSGRASSSGAPASSAGVPRSGPTRPSSTPRSGEWSEIRYSMCERARIGADAHVGPFAALGPGSVVADGEPSPPSSPVRPAERRAGSGPDRPGRLG